MTIGRILAYTAILTAAGVASVLTAGSAEGARPISSPIQQVALPEEDGYVLAATPIAAPFERLVDFAVIPGSNDGLVLMQDGYIYMTPLDGSGPPALFADMSSMVVFSPSQSEEGLLTILFHPDYPVEPYVYIYYNATGPSCGWWCDRMSRFEVDLENDVLDLASELIILEFPDPAQTHNGAGPIGFGSDGYLFASFGDGGLFAENNAQDTGSLFGTVVRIDVLNPPPGEPYGVPGDNPFHQTRQRSTRSGRTACVTPGAAASTPFQESSGWATWATDTGTR